jgi:thermitase
MARCGVAFVIIALFVLMLPHEASAAPGANTERLLVGVEPSMGPSQVDALASRMDGRVVKRIAGGSVLVVEVPRERRMRAAMVGAADAKVKFLEPDGIVYPLIVPNDPEYPNQYHLPLIRAPEGWNITTGSSSVVIAVVDTGVDIDHPDLAGRTLPGWDFIENDGDPRPKPDPNNKSSEANDQVSHGTLVAGIAAATGNDGWGTAGLDWNAKILPVKVFSATGGSTVSTVIEGIDFAIDRGAHIINLSLGGGYFESFTPAITRAWNAGVLVVAAAGNGGREMTDLQSTWESPVCNIGNGNFVLGVGSTTRNDLRASFSNYDGSAARLFVDVMAPGEGIYGPGYYNPAYPSFSSYFTTNTGTSFSAPMVSGLAALLLSRNPGMSPAQLMHTIRNGADNIDALNPGFAGKLGAGRINVARTLGASLAPMPPRDLQAADTKDDSGGSITLTWRTSLDDGSGSNTVSEYIVLRRRGASGAFEEVGRVPAGTIVYLDNTTVDGVDYYYIVRSSDGNLTSDSQVAGPVQSFNDKPPPPVGGVEARDRPDDDGGAIIISWARYSAPEDFSHFAIYRATTQISTVGDRTPIVEIRDPSVTEYVDTTTVDGIDYYYAVNAVDQVGNQQTRPASVGPVRSFANAAMTLPAGMYLFGSPVEPVDREPLTLLQASPAQMQMAKWRPQSGDYAVFSGPGSLPLELGQGYWLKLQQPTTFTPAGKMAPAGGLQLSLQPGWHQLSNPYFGKMDIAAATVVYQGTTMDLPSADAAGVFRQVIWTYSSAANGYNLVAPFLGIGESRIDPWQGFWVRVEKPCVLVLPRPVSVSSREVRPIAAANHSEGTGWVARLSARGSSSVDNDNFFGISPRMAAAGPLHSPPPVAGGVQLFFTDPAGLRSAGAFSAVDARELNWDVMVTGTPGETVEVWCPTPDQIPRGWSAVLVDRASGSTVDVRRGASYRFTLRDDEVARPLTLRLTQSSGLLTLSSVSAQATGSGGAEVVFSMSAPAETTVQVMNIAGRTVRVVEHGVSRPAGTSQVAWDGRSDSGVVVPSGMYLLRIEAAGEDGTRTQAMRTVSISR